MMKTDRKKSWQKKGPTTSKNYKQKEKIILIKLK